MVSASVMMDGQGDYVTVKLEKNSTRHCAKRIRQLDRYAVVEETVIAASVNAKRVTLLVRNSTVKTASAATSTVLGIRTINCVEAQNKGCVTVESVNALGIGQDRAVVAVQILKGASKMELCVVIEGHVSAISVHAMVQQPVLVHTVNPYPVV